MKQFRVTVRWYGFHYPAKWCWRLAEAMHQRSNRLDRLGNRLNERAG